MQNRKTENKNQETWENLSTLHTQPGRNAHKLKYWYNDLYFGKNSSSFKS